MKYILNLITIMLCLVIHQALAQSSPVVSSTAKIIRIDDIGNIDLSSVVSRTPNSCTGVLLSEEGHVFTSDKLVKPGDASSGVEYMVLFPVYKQDNVYAVHAYLARSQALSVDNHLMVLKVNKAELPAIVNVSDTAVKSNMDIINVGYPDAIAKSMSYEDRGRVNMALKEIASRLKLRDTRELVVTNENQDNAQLMQYVTPQEDKGHVIRTTSQQGTRTEIQHRTSIDSGSEGSPLVDASTRQLVGLTTSVISGSNPYNNAQSAGTVQALSKTYNVKLGSAGIAAVVQDSTTMYLLIGAAVVVIAIVVALLLCRKKAPAPAQGSSIAIPAVPPVPGADAPVEKTVVLSHVLFELKADSGEVYQVTSDMARRTVRIGRAPSCELKFSHPTVSANHALLCAHNGRPAIADTNSSGGTMVNGAKLKPQEPKTLHRGDVIVLGSCNVKVS